MRTPRDLAIGSLINGKYRLVAQIGAGGMGKIYKAEQLPLGRTVAVKVVHPHLGQQGGGKPGEAEAFQRRFFREASALSQLRHRGIVTVFDYGQIEGRDSFFMVMELLEGEPLSARLRGGQRLDELEVLGLVRQLGRALREVHRQGMVHRDLKPANIFLVHEGDELVCKLLDFGLVKQARPTGDPDELTEAGALLGSPTYMAPEQIDGREVDARTDLYALGVVLYHCLAGLPPFEGSLTQVMIQHAHQPPPPLSERCPGVAFSPALERVVRRCLEKEPAQRYADADEMLRDLQEAEQMAGYAPMMSGAYLAAPSSRSSGSLAPLSPGSYPGTLRPSVPPSYPGSLTSSPSSSGARVALSPSSSGLRAAPDPASQATLAEEGGPQATLAGAERSASIRAGVGRSRLGTAALVGVPLVAVLLVLALRPWASREVAPGAASERASAAVTASAAPSGGVVSLDSIPTGAQVIEGSTVLGVTPLELPAGERKPGSRRTLVLQVDGYELFTLEQLVPAEATRVVIPLKELPPIKTPTSKGTGRPGRSPAAAPDTAAAPPAIRMNR